MHCQANITFTRDIGRQGAVFIDAHVTVSGRVTELRDEYLVMLDRGLDLWTLEEMDRAEQVLIEKYLLAHPYVLSAVA